MKIIVSIPDSTATIKVSRAAGRVLLQPENFDRSDPNQVAALATVLDMVKNAAIDLPADDELHEKAAIVSIPGGQDQQQLPTTPPGPDQDVAQAANLQEILAQMQAMQQRLDQLEQAMGAQAQPVQGPTPGAPPPGAPAPAGATPMGPGLGG